MSRTPFVLTLVVCSLAACNKAPAEVQRTSVPGMPDQGAVRTYKPVLCGGPNDPAATAHASFQRDGARYHVVEVDGKMALYQTSPMTSTWLRTDNGWVDGDTLMFFSVSPKGRFKGMTEVVLHPQDGEIRHFDGQPDWVLDGGVYKRARPDAEPESTECLELVPDEVDGMDEADGSEMPGESIDNAAAESPE